MMSKMRFYYAQAFIVAFFLPSFLTFLMCTRAISAECLASTLVLKITAGTNQPSDVAIAPNGDLYLVDGVNNQIVVLDGKGKKKFSFGKKGTGPGAFMQPLGIDVFEDGNVFVADTGNQRIQVFDSQGNFQYQFTVMPGSGDRPPEPVDVLASKLQQYVYVADNENHKIKVYKRDGLFAFEWGSFGEGTGKFRYPGLLAVNDFNEIFVVDVLNTRVQKFTPFGEYIATIGSWGVFPGKLFRPKGVVVDRKNRVFVTDSYMGCVQAFTDLGRFLGVVCENGEKVQFVTPVGVALSENEDFLYVVEMKANQVRLLKLQE